MEMASQVATVGGREYRIGRLDVFDALHVARMIAPLAPVFVGQVYAQVMALVAKYRDSGEEPEKLLNESVELIRMLEPMLYRLSLMDRASFESVVKTCLKAVERKDGRIYGRVMSDGNLMYADLGAAEIFQLVIAVIGRELRPIFAALFKSE